MLLIASYITEPPVCLFQFGGFMRKVWPEHWFPVCTYAVGTTSMNFFSDVSWMHILFSTQIALADFGGALRTLRGLCPWLHHLNSGASISLEQVQVSVA